MHASHGPDEPLEVEVERIDPEATDGGPGRSSRARLAAGLTGVLGGVALDLLDFATLGPLGARLGLPIGFLLGWWWGGGLGLAPRRRLGLAIAAGVYCMLPGTRALPLGTLFGVLQRFGRGARE